MAWVIVVLCALAVVAGYVLCRRLEHRRLADVEARANAVPPELLRSVANEVVDGLVRGDYGAVARRCATRRTTADDLRRAIEVFGEKLITPPSSAFLEPIRVIRARVPTWGVVVRLWTQEQGESDLVLELEISVDGEQTKVAVEKLYVP